VREGLIQGRTLQESRLGYGQYPRMFTIGKRIDRRRRGEQTEGKTDSLITTKVLAGWNTVADTKEYGERQRMNTKSQEFCLHNPPTGIQA